MNLLTRIFACLYSLIFVLPGLFLLLIFSLLYKQTENMNLIKVNRSDFFTVFLVKRILCVIPTTAVLCMVNIINKKFYEGQRYLWNVSLLYNWTIVHWKKKRIVSRIQSFCQ